MLVHACGQRTAYAIQRSVAADGNAQENEDWTGAFIAAVQLGLQGLELDDLRSVLAKDRALAQRPISSTGATSLHFAAAKGIVPMMKLLLEFDASVSAKTSSGKTPLALACAAVMLDAAAVLVEHGAQNEPSCGAAALHAAVHASRVDVVERLLQGGASTAVADSDDGATPLHIAAITGNVQIAKLLLHYNAPHDARYKISGETPLHVAAIKSQRDVARILINSGANVSARSTSGQTPLHAAAIHADPPVLQLLIERGAQTDATWRLGATSLHEAAARGIAESVAMLLRGGAPSAQEDVYGDAALTWAASRGHSEVAELLIQLGRAPLSSNKFGITALHAAAFGGHRMVAQTICTLLLPETCDEHQALPDAFGDTPHVLMNAEPASPALRTGTDEAMILDDLQPPLPAAWRDAARRIASPTERRLLVYAEAPESIDAHTLIRELAQQKQSLTFDRRVRTMLNSTTERAILGAPAILDATACAALKGAVDADASLRNGTTDGMPEHTLHIDRAQLEALIGTGPVDALWSLPREYARKTTTLAVSGEVDRAAPRAIECFIRKFSSETRPWIKMHADVAAITVNIALTSDANRATGRLLGVFDHAVRQIPRSMGDATVHSSSLLHGVSRMPNGEAPRYTLILFFEME